MNVREAYMRASSFLREKGLDDHAVSAEWLLQHVLGVNRARLLLLWSDPISEDQFERLWALSQRRAMGEPVQYIVGETYFYGLPFRVTKDVLIPRPETELLVERIVHLGKRLWTEGTPLSVVDVGTGSGAIAVALAHAVPEWRITAVDISAAALSVASGNAERNGVLDRIAFEKGDLLEPIAGKTIDMIVSNPPYIPSADIDELQVEVRDFEPRLALDGGQDGLEPYRRMVSQIAEGGIRPRLIGFETGLGLARHLLEMLESTELWDEIEIVQDLAGIERHVIGYSGKLLDS